MSSAEYLVSDYYNKEGWDEKNGLTQDALRDEDLRNCAKEYISKCRLRTLKYIPSKGDKIIDLGSGPIQYAEYLQFSSNYKKRYCIDLSQKALDEAEKKLGKYGEYLHGSFFELDLPKDGFDCAISLHCIYHMDQNKQEDAIRKLLSIVKPGRPVIIVYSNPFSLEQVIIRPIKFFIKLFLNFVDYFRYSILQKEPKFKRKFYFKPNSLFWWRRFNKLAVVKIKPWRTFSAKMQKIIFPDNNLGKNLFKLLFLLEEKFPSLFVFLGTYPIIIITKK